MDSTLIAVLNVVGILAEHLIAPLAVIAACVKYLLKK